MGTKNKKKYKLLSLLMAFALLVTTCLPMSAMAAGTEGADCVKVSSTAPTEEETVAGAKYELDLSKVFTDSDSHSLTYTLENTDLGGYTQIKDHTLYFTENKPGKYNVKLKATCTSGKSATHTLAMTVKAAAEGSKDQYSYEETAAEKVTVWVTMSNDGVPLMGNDEDSTKLSHLKVTVPYFDLSAYGLGQFARKGTAKDPNMGHKGDYINNTVIERPTYLHLLIWLTERYYLGLSESECGKGQDSSHVIDNTNTTSVKTIFGKEAYSSNGLSAFGLKDGTASATSMLINNLWGHDMNFMYLRNHVYPLMDAGWGATADYILLSDNDVLDIALFSDWTFYQRGAFNKFDQEVYTAEPGSDLIFSTLKYDTQSPSDGGAGDFTKIDKLNIGLYNADWEKVSDVEIDGSGGDYYIDVLPDVEGTYYLLGMDLLADTENSYTACYAPAVAELDIKKADPFEGMPFTDLYYMDGDKKVQLTKIEELEGGLSCTDYPTYKNLPAYKVTIPEELASKGLTVYAKIKTTESITTSMANFSVVSQAVDWNNTLTATATKDGEETLVSFNIPEEKASIYIGENANYAVVQTTGWSGVMGFSFVGGDISDEPKPTDPYEGMPFTDLYYMDGDKKVQLTKIEAVEGGLSCTDYPTYKNLPAYKVTIPEELASKGLTVYAKIKTTESITTSMANFSVVSQAVDWNNTLTATATKDGEETLVSFNIPEEKASIYIGENANYAVVQTTGWSGVMGLSFVGGTIDSGNDKPSDGKVTGVTLNKTSLTMPRWSTATLTATVQPEAAKVKIVKWSSSDDSIVSVEKGVLTSHKAGKADITVMTVQNEKTATCHVTVTDPDMPPTDTDGTYEVSTAKQLLWISNQAEATSTKYKGTSMNVKLMNDIDLSEVCGESKGSWKPISIFCGTFDGQNHKIKNIYGEYAGPNDPTGNSIPGYGGLFGRVREATIKNLSVYGTVKATGAEDYASTNVGAICGSASDATIENCHNYASVTGVGGRLESVAGIVAYLSLGSKVENCSNHGTISGNKPGGIASTAYLSSGNGDGIFNCWNEGTINGDNSSTAGGIICSTGITSMTIENCYNTGAVSAAGWGYKDRASVGGIAGGASSSFGNTYTFRNCYNRGNLSSTVPNALIGAITPVQDEKTGYVFENCYYVEGTMNPSDSVAAVKEVKSSELPATLLGTGYQESCPTPVLATQSAVAHADSDGDGICDTCGKVMKVTSGYTITAGEAKTVNITEDAQLTLKVGSADSDTTYNSYVVKVSYDSNVLEYKGINGTDNDTDGSRRIVEDDKAGTLTITGYGKDRTIGIDNIELTFTGKKAGAGQVKVVSANIDKQENANVKDAPPATILDGGSSMITVSDYYPVTFDDTLFNGSHLAQNGKRYSLNVTDIHYDYQVSATMNGEAVDVQKYEDRNSGYFYFYINDVTGPLKFTGTRTEKNYTVTKDETGTGSTDLTLLGETATYLHDYTFTVDQKEGYTYTVTVTCGGETYTGLEQPTPGSYKIPGTDVTGDLVIKVDKTVDDTKWTKISFTGTGSGDVKGEPNQSGLNNKDFTFEITKAEGFTYTVTLDGTVLNPDESGIYTIPAAKMTGTALTVTVEKKGELTIEVSNYLTMKNSQTMWLVTAKGAVNTGKTLAYGTEGNMFWSEKYNAYAFLVVSGDNESQVKDAATAVIVEATAEKQTVTYNSDINGTGNVDINDAQLVYNMYNAMYDDFTDVTMEKFLKADVTGDKTVNVSDAAAVVNELIKTN